MNKNGPIIIIEDDIDDQEILSQIFSSLDYDYEIIFIEDGIKALEYLAESSIKPFIIISDINLPKLDGIELRNKIHNNEQLRLRCIPYLFLTTTSAHDAVVEAYSHSVQGFFIKPTNFTHFERTIKRIVEYWQECVAPNYTSHL